MVQWVSVRFFNSFLVCCLLYLIKEVRSDEFCKAIAQQNHETFVPSVVPIGMTYSETNATQNECVKYYKIDLTGKQPQDQYLSFKISFVTKPTNDNLMPFLIQQTNSTPEVDEGGQFNDTVTISDMTGYGNNKPYYYIVVDIGALKSTDSLYFGVYEFWLPSNKTLYQPEQIKYNITTQVSGENDYPCPLDCSGVNQGLCNQQLKQCVCSQTFFDVDCSVSGTQLLYQGSVSQVITPDKWTYFYIDSKDYGGNLKMAVGKDPGQLYLMFLFNYPQDFYLPNFFEYDGRFYLGFDSTKQNLRLPQNGLREHSGGRLMVGAYNSGTRDINLQLSVSLYEEEEASRSAIMFVMIGIACGLIFLWVVFSLLKYRAYRHAALIRRQQQIMHQQSILTNEEVDKYFPVKKFGDWTSSFPQTLCSICLDDFQPDTLCRQLFCEHIYHGPCIEAWLANHLNCPNCKKDITREEAEEHLKNPNRPKPVQRSPDVEEGKLMNNGSSPERDVLNNISREVLNNISLGDVKEKQTNGNAIDLDLPLSKRQRPDKLDKAEIILEPVETVVVPVQKSPTVTGIEIKNEIEENRNVEYNKEFGKSMHEEH